MSSLVGRVLSSPLVWLILACAAAVTLHCYSLTNPVLVMDDFQLLQQSWTWPLAWQNLWLPTNEHAMPPGRLTTWLLVQAAGAVTRLPFVAAWHGPLALALGMVLIYLFVSRELRHSFYGLLAATMFGVTSVHQQAIDWFAASFSVLTLDCLLLGLLAVQRWRMTGQGWWLDLAVVWCFLSPCWFASGILAGPICFLYLVLPTERDDLPPPSRGRFQHWTLMPLLGSALFLAVSLPRTAGHIMSLGHYGGKTPVQAFNPLMGLLYSGRAVVDNLFLGQFGIGGLLPLPIWLGAILVAALGLGLVWWAVISPRRRLLVVGLGLIGGAYLLTFGARSNWPYEDLVAWSRYHLMPQAGLALIVCGGLPRWGNVWQTASGSRMTTRQCWIVGLLVGVLFAVHMSHATFGSWSWTMGNRQQQEDLSRIAQVDELCRAQGIAAEAAREALEPFFVDKSFERVNGWEFLRGSPEPIPMDRDTVRRLLDP